MNELEISQILGFIGQEYQKNTPNSVKFLAGREIKKMLNYHINDLPMPLRKCTVEELLLVLQNGIRTGRLKI